MGAPGAVAVFLVIVLLGVGAYLYLPDLNHSSGGAGAITLTWLQYEAVNWKPSQNASIGWSVFFQAASYDNIESTSSANIQADLSMLLSSGASCIRMDIGFDAWLQGNTAIQNEISGLVNQIKSAGKCLIIADASAESYRANPIPWTQFKEAWVQRVATLSALYKPNFYETIKEPGWYAPMISDVSTNPQATSVSDFLNLTQWLSSTVLANSPNTKVGVAVPGNALSKSFYDQWFNGASKQAGITFLGFDNYETGDFNQTISYLNQYGSNGKSLWIAEAGSTVGYPPNTLAQMSLDAYWIQILYYFGLKIHATNLIPFWTGTFASYTVPPNYSERTPLFYEYQDLATSYSGVVS